MVLIVIYTSGTLTRFVIGTGSSFTSKYQYILRFQFQSMEYLMIVNSITWSCMLSWFLIVCANIYVSHNIVVLKSPHCSTLISFCCRNSNHKHKGDNDWTPIYIDTHSHIWYKMNAFIRNIIRHSHHAQPSSVS